ncbi:unnamed protein product [Protopolystoma xenopodis]|uniref:Glycosyltransferase 2-like domain-containing protein n=1 Tax=Protopolystoma xenopodis TaxID=117903 RepID=A0A448WVY0_9PLAT|nr:unnamed protein product [Protopolystoma xenopodis]
MCNTCPISSRAFRIFPQTRSPTCRMNRGIFRVAKYFLIFAFVFAIINISSQMWPVFNDISFIRHLDHDLNPKDPIGRKIDWHNYAQIELEKRKHGPGEHGSAIVIESFEKEENDRIFLVNGYNGLVSDKMSLTRSIKDIRHPDCKKALYYENLPTTSIIIPFYNEHLSTLLRTVESAMFRAPKHLIKDVILVDDGSTKPSLKGPLEEYLANNYPLGNVRVLRHIKRVGLMAARLTGARNCTGEVMLFLDSHCEVGTNWLPPLLDPIAQDYRTVVCPFIDVIDAFTFEYRAQDEGARGAFDWEFFYKRLPRLPEDAKHPSQPFDSPIMAGGLFVISSKWFWELGGYDPGLMIWGGEQYELSFKIWMCGGKIIDTPCSRIGHVYRRKSVFPNPGIGDFIGVNYRRVAEVWMDEYKEYIYDRRPHYRDIDPGDLSQQKALRQRLKCKSFDWFMKTVAFDLIKRYPMIEPIPAAKGLIRSFINSTLCIDGGALKAMESVNLKPCSPNAPNQNFVVSWYDEIRVEKG